MTLLMLLNCLFNEKGMGYLVLICLLLFIAIFNLSIGTIAFIHAQETCVDEAAALANKTVFQNIVMQTLIGCFIIDKGG